MATLGENMPKRNSRKMRNIYTSLVASASGPVLVRRLPDGTECVLTVAPVTALPDACVLASALRDPDAQPLTDATMHLLRRKPRGEMLRRLLASSQGC